MFKESIKFLKALLVFIRMYRDGFYFSESVHQYKDGRRWGFYRFNEKTEPELFDVDFSFHPSEESFFHVHGDNFRMDFNPSTTQECLRKKMKKVRRK